MNDWFLSGVQLVHSMRQVDITSGKENREQVLWIRRAITQQEGDRIECVCFSILKDLFTYLLYSLFGKTHIQREKETHREKNFLLLVHSPGNCNSRSWAEPKAGACSAPKYFSFMRISAAALFRLDAWMEGLSFPEAREIIAVEQLTIAMNSSLENLNTQPGPGF